MQKTSKSKRATQPLHLPAALLSLGLAGAAPQVAEADPGFDETVEKALNLGGGDYGKINFDSRWRWEYVDQNTPKTGSPANASTIRTRIGYLTPTFLGFQGFIEYEGNHLAGADEFNDNPKGDGNRKTRFPVVADPIEDEVNQAWLSFSGLPSTTIKAGRQRIAFDNHRFIGDVIWRQMQQTYDAVTLTSTLLPRTTATAGYIFGVQDIFSRHVGMSSPVVNVNFDSGYGKLIGYGYWLDYNDANDSNKFGNSTQTYGVRFDNSVGLSLLENLKALYTLEYAHQQNYENNPKRYEADYWLVDGGFNLFGVTLRGAYEELGASKGIGFATPLSTLHAFQGWADLFLATPKDGIRDMQGILKYKLPVVDVDFLAVYHDFSDHSGRMDYGHEVDLQMEKKFGKHYAVLLKFADFVADKDPKTGKNALGKPDTQKFWVQASVAF
jgi:hypothetical protein